MFKKVQHPILFQGNLNKKNYFEGWYYKQVSADQNVSLSFIPAVSLNESDQHSFIQYILVQTDEDGLKSTHTGYIRYAVTDFIYEENPFSSDNRHPCSILRKAGPGDRRADPDLSVRQHGDDLPADS